MLSLISIYILTKTNLLRLRMHGRLLSDEQTATEPPSIPATNEAGLLGLNLAQTIP